MIEHIDFFAEDNPVVTCRPSPNFTFVGQSGLRRNLVTGGAWAQTGQPIQVQARGSSNIAGPVLASMAEEAAALPAETPPWVAIKPCAAGTTCFGAPGTKRADLLVRTLPLGGGRV